MLFARGRAVIRNGFEGLLGKSFGQIFRVGNGGGTADEARLASVKIADAPNTPQNVGQVATVNAAVHV